MLPLLLYSQEHEGIDRHDTKLPGLQLSFAQSVLQAAKGKPLTLILCNGGFVSFDQLVDGSGAIIEAFNPIDHVTAA